jgi:hypothetical protein
MAQVSTLFGGADITPSTFARIIVAVHDSQSMTADSKHPQRYMFHLFRIGCSRRGAQDRVVMLRTFRQFWMPPCHLETRADFIPEGERKLSDIPLSPFHRPAFRRMSLSRASWTHCTQHGASRFREQRLRDFNVVPVFAAATCLWERAIGLMQTLMQTNRHVGSSPSEQPRALARAAPRNPKSTSNINVQSRRPLQ